MDLTKESFKLTTTNCFWIIGFTWLLFQIFFLMHFGIVTNYEAEKYISEAETFLKTNSFSSGNFLFYSVEILLIAFSKLTNSFPWFVVLVQLVVNAISIVLFYRLSYYLTRSNSKAFLLTMLFLGMFYYHLYNVHLFTESLYYSFGIVYTYILFTTAALSKKSILKIIFFLSLLYFTRPTGLFFIPATVVFLLFKFYRNRAFALLALSAILSIILVYFLLNFALGSGGEFDFIVTYSEKMIICGVSGVNEKQNIIVPVEKNSVESLWYIITNHTSLFFEMAGRRFIAFWGVIRNYFSAFHNIYIGVYFYSVYIMIFLGFRKLASRFLPEILFLITVIFFITVTVVLSCDEWHNRFIFSLLPFLILMGGGVFITKPGFTEIPRNDSEKYTGSSK